ncbi:hypothetical protein KJ742_07475 [Patescibacteria group bacterium]|nr:hypothetical protein [Patescibacteria group bacterium]MBU1683751.1 hypothetical protein [Patescibacteria group bacterium]MBU1934560.1 hypothetical protein [Patescibacteria group bacterium]
MKFKADNKIFENYPDFIDGILVVKNIDNNGTNPEITELLRKIEKEIREITDIESVNSHPKIAAWREAHRKFGNNPKKSPPSVQAIFGRVYKGGELPIINKLVDLYNYISLKYVVPAGGENLDKCVGDIELTYADGDEEFIELESVENRPPETGEVVYKDQAGVICRKFNWREADRTKLSENTKNAVLVIEGLSPVTRDELQRTLDELQELVQKYCGGESNSYILDQDNREIEI